LEERRGIVQKIKLRVNGVMEEVSIEPWWSLAFVLREKFNLTGVKVLIDGKAVKSCLFVAPKANGKDILTIEGLSKDGKLHPLQEAFIEHFAVQCGYCTPGMIMAAKALFDENPNPTEEEVKEALRGNFCRCTGYVKIVEACLVAKKKI
jgi:carbon-monoxide dehydrogenase small subunit